MSQQTDEKPLEGYPHNLTTYLAVWLNNIGWQSEVSINGAQAILSELQALTPNLKESLIEFISQESPQIEVSSRWKKRSKVVPLQAPVSTEHTPSNARDIELNAAEGSKISFNEASGLDTTAQNELSILCGEPEAIESHSETSSLEVSIDETQSVLSPVDSEAVASDGYIVEIRTETHSVNPETDHTASNLIADLSISNEPINQMLTQTEPVDIVLDVVYVEKPEAIEPPAINKDNFNLTEIDQLFADHEADGSHSNQEHLFTQARSSFTESHQELFSSQLIAPFLDSSEAKQNPETVMAQIAVGETFFLFRPEIETLPESMTEIFVSDEKKSQTNINFNPQFEIDFLVTPHVDDISTAKIPEFLIFEASAQNPIEENTVIDHDYNFLPASSIKSFEHTHFVITAKDLPENHTDHPTEYSFQEIEEHDDESEVFSINSAHPFVFPIEATYFLNNEKSELPATLAPSTIVVDLSKCEINVPIFAPEVAPVNESDDAKTPSITETSTLLEITHEDSVSEQETDEHSTETKAGYSSKDVHFQFVSGDELERPEKPQKKSRVQPLEPLFGELVSLEDEVMSKNTSSISAEDIIHQAKQRAAEAQMKKKKSFWPL